MNLFKGDTFLEEQPAKKVKIRYSTRNNGFFIS